MTTADPMVREKIAQVPALLEELGLDAWVLFGRETHAMHDPSFDLVVGTNVTWASAFILTRAGDRIAVVGSLDRANLETHGHYDEIVPYVGGISADLRRVFSRIDPRRLAVNWSTSDASADGLTHGMYLLLREALEGGSASTPRTCRWSRGCACSATRLTWRTPRPGERLSARRSTRPTWSTRRASSCS